MTKFLIKVNSESRSVEADSDTPLLWLLRDSLQLRGTKFGCGIGQCGACTIHLDGVAVRSCTVPISAINDSEVITIEGMKGPIKEALDKGWIDHDVPQCGYCQAGQLMTAASLLRKNSRPTEAEIKTEMNGNICRCGTYNRIKSAIQTASNEL